MRKKSIMTALAVGSLVLATVSLQAADPMAGGSKTPTAKPRASQNKNQTQPDQSSAMQSRFTVTQIIGCKVLDEHGQSLGKVQNLVVNLNSDKAPFAVIEYGGTLGFGDHYAAVPFKDLEWSSDAKTVTLSATKEQFEAASTTPTGAWAAVADEAWAKHIDRFYGQPLAATASAFERTPLTSANEPLQSPKQTVDPATQP